MESRKCVWMTSRRRTARRLRCARLSRAGEGSSEAVSPSALRLEDSGYLSKTKEMQTGGLWGPSVKLSPDVGGLLSGPPRPRKRRDARGARAQARGLLQGARRPRIRGARRSGPRRHSSSGGHRRGTRRDLPATARGPYRPVQSAGGTNRCATSGNRDQAARARRRREPGSGGQAFGPPRPDVRAGAVRAGRLSAPRQGVRRSRDRARGDGESALSGHQGALIEDASPELRIDPLSGHRAIIAGARAGRPGGELSAEPPQPLDRETDPFAEGHEDRTPPELYAVRPDGGPPNSPGWRVRVVPNLYPALKPAADGDTAQEPQPRPGANAARDLFWAAPALGAHEVIVNAPAPVMSLADREVSQVEWRIDA